MLVLVLVRYGYVERPNVPAALELIDRSPSEGPMDLSRATYFLDPTVIIGSRLQI